MVTTGTGNGLRARGYTPYGYAPPSDSRQSVLGYNGEYADQVTGSYHLGNGYRAYSPTLMRFTAPDSLSPFGGGGLNTYAYCAGDPINASDPSGHMKWYMWAAAIIGTVGATAAVGLNGWELISAWRAIQKFEQIDELASGFVTTSDRARSLVTLNKSRLLLHGILVTKDAASLGLQGWIDVAAFKRNATAVGSASAIQAILAGADFYGAYKAGNFRGLASGHESAFYSFRNRIENSPEAMPLAELPSAVEPAGEGPIDTSTPLLGRRSPRMVSETPSEHIYMNWPPSRSSSEHIYDMPPSRSSSGHMSTAPRAHPVSDPGAANMLPRTACVAIRRTVSDPEFFINPGAREIAHRWGLTDSVTYMDEATRWLRASA